MTTEAVNACIALTGMTVPTKPPTEMNNTSNKVTEDNVNCVYLELWHSKAVIYIARSNVRMEIH